MEPTLAVGGTEDECFTARSGSITGRVFSCCPASRCHECYYESDHNGVSANIRDTHGGNSFGTNLIENGTLVTAVSGLPGGWIDNTRLLVGNYQRSPTDGPGPGGYVGCTIYDPSGHVAGSCALPYFPVFQTITSDLLCAPNLNSIFSVSAGTATAASAVAGTHVPELNGGPCRDRTYDQEIKSLLLYQLS